MTSFLAALLRGLFPALVLAFAVIVLAGAGLYGLASGNVLTAAVLAVAGLMTVVVLFGMLALQIENHALLARIAEAQAPLPEAATAPGRDLVRDLGREFGRDVGRAASGRPEPGRHEPGRREPVVTLRPQASYEPI